MTRNVPTPEHPAIACTLEPGSFRDRLAWIQSLNARALREHYRDGLTLHLTYEPNAKDALHELVRRERACCGFLRFELREERNGVHVAVVAPEEAREVAEILFADFVAADDPGAAAEA